MQQSLFLSLFLFQWGFFVPVWAESLTVEPETQLEYRLDTPGVLETFDLVSQPDLALGRLGRGSLLMQGFLGLGGLMLLGYYGAILLMLTFLVLGEDHSASLTGVDPKANDGPMIAWLLGGAAAPLITTLPALVRRDSRPLAYALLSGYIVLPFVGAFLMGAKSGAFNFIGAAVIAGVMLLGILLMGSIDIFRLASHSLPSPERLAKLPLNCRSLQQKLTGERFLQCGWQESIAF